jgi:hypothetical protein
MIRKTGVESPQWKLPLFTTESVTLPQAEQRELELALTELLLHAATGREVDDESTVHESQDHV